MLTVTTSNLIYTPTANSTGADTFAYKLNDGFADSNVETVRLNFLPVNDSPVALSQLVSTDEDTPLPITLGAQDPDGDVLTFDIMQPAHGTLSGTAPNLLYTPTANYFGEDVFTFTVRDTSNVVSQLAAVSITVRPINDAPVPHIEVSPLNELPGVTNLITIAPVCCAATLRLDGSQSSDVENDPLTYLWLAGTNVLSTDAILTNHFLLGTHEITLVVSDGAATTNTMTTVEIITANEAVDFLRDLTDAGVTEQRLRGPLLVWLRLANESFEHCRVELGVSFLELYVRRVQDRLMAHDPVLATNLINTAEAIIEAAPDCDPCQRLGRHHRRERNDRDRRDGSRQEGRGAADSEAVESEPEPPAPTAVRESRPGLTIERSSPGLR
jgi:hypothetical protein